MRLREQLHERFEGDVLDHVERRDRAEGRVGRRLQVREEVAGRHVQARVARGVRGERVNLHAARLEAFLAQQREPLAAAAAQV